VNSSTSSSNQSAPTVTGLARYRYVLAVCAAAAVFVGVNQVAVNALGTPSVAENNSQVVILRAQQYEFGDVPRAVLAGSSISGRLKADDFAEAGYPLANLGLDGLSASFGLDIILEQATMPEVVLVEVNTLDKPVGANAETINEVRRGFSYDLARSLEFMRAESRPSTVVYDQLRTRRNSGFTVEPTSVPIIETLVAPGAEPDTGAEVVAVEKSIQDLQASGVQVLLVVLPTGEDEADALQVGEAVSSRTGVPLLDLSGLGDEPELYTDGTHLTPIAATKVAQELAFYLNDRG
jgi:hypothetical protein